MVDLLTTHILLSVKHEKPLPELPSIAAGRVYTYNGVNAATAKTIANLPQFLSAARATVIVHHDTPRRLRAGTLAVQPADPDQLLQQPLETRAPDRPAPIGLDFRDHEQLERFIARVAGERAVMITLI